MKKKQKNKWTFIKGDYRLSEPDKGIFSSSSMIPLTVLANKDSGEIRLFAKNTTDIIGIEKAFKLSEKSQAE